MGEMVHLEMVCDSCNGRIEYLPVACGETVACPHCNNPTFLLYQEAKPQFKSSPASFHRNEPSPPPRTFNRENLKIADVEYEVRQIIEHKLLQDSSRKGSKIKSFSLVNEVGNKYNGILEIQTGKKIETCGVDVTHDGRNIIWKISPSTDPESIKKLEDYAGVGGFLFVGGIICTIYFFMFYPTNNPGSDYVNLERLNTRQDGIIIGIGACLLGLVIFLVFMLVANGQRKEQ